MTAGYAEFTRTGAVEVFGVLLHTAGAHACAGPC